MPSSGEGGPCDHCGRTQSCCWRRGPTYKPCLCNACGSRYLVKKNLDGYIPVVQRQSTSNKSPKATKPKSRQTITVGAKISKPRRTGTRRVLDSTTWYSDQVDSEEDSYMTDDSVGPITANLQQENAAAAAVAAAGLDSNDNDDDNNMRPRPANRPSLLGDSSRSNVVRVNTETEVRVMDGDVYGQLKVALKNSLRVKRRKPLNPTITAVY